MVNFALLLLAYLLGSIPFGLLFAKLFNIKDLRTAGSGNIGATNALRVGGKKLGILTLLFDVLKGFLAVYTVTKIAPNLEGPAFLATALGHLFPIWLKFKGGKGVAVFIGGLFGISLGLAGLSLITWLFIFILKRISSLSAIIMIILTPLYLILLSELKLLPYILIVSTLIIYRHKDNLIRIKQGIEPQTKFKK